MLLIVGRAGDAGNNSKDRAKSVVHAINSVCHPTAAAAMPALAFQNCVEDSAWAELRHHCLQSACVRFFFECAFAQKILYVVLARENTLTLVAELGFVFF